MQLLYGEVKACVLYLLKEDSQLVAINAKSGITSEGQSPWEPTALDDLVMFHKFHKPQSIKMLSSLMFCLNL